MKRGLITALVAIASLAATAVPAAAQTTLSVSEHCLQVDETGQLQSFDAFATGHYPNLPVDVYAEPEPGRASIGAYKYGTGVTDAQGGATVWVSEAGNLTVPPGAKSVFVKLFGWDAFGTAVDEIEVQICQSGGDPDADGDQIPDAVDNCPNSANADQADADNDGIGNACDTDADNDGTDDGVDNCPNAANPDQADADNDGIGNVCDPTPLPVPTSKEQCMKGAWKAYGIFKNQGDCVSFVASKEKNPPAAAR